MKTHFTFSCLVFAVCVAFAISVKAQVNKKDSLALVDLYNSTNGPGWYNQNNWLTGPVSSWHGIAVNNKRVSVIDLYDNRLKGIIPSSIGDLSDLSYLYLDVNQLTGNIPPELGNLSNLMELFLNDNQLSGNIPPELGKLSNLFGLILNDNQLNGVIPSELGNLSNIYDLSLYNNQLSGNIPASVYKLPQLYALRLNNNKLKGSVSAKIGNLKNVQILHLNNNKLSGNIPPEIGNLPLLSELRLDTNQLTGSIPQELGTLAKSLHNLYLNNNQLSGNIPPELGKLSRMHRLNLSNNQLSGSIPPEIGRPRKITSLNLSNNQLTGIVPASIYRLEELQELRLSHNKLKGSLSSLQVSNLANLQYLFLDHNQLRGPVSADIADLFNLDSLDISYNQFTFDGMELVAQTFPLARYSNQANIPVLFNNNALSVSAGGSLINNNYFWYKVGEPGYIKIKGDSVFHPTESGVYYVKVKNKIATGLILKSNTISYIAPVSPNAFSSTNKPAVLNNSFTVYPNPAKDILHVETKGNGSFSLLSEAGELIRTEKINNSGSINISGIAAGVYYLRNNNTNAVEIIFVIK